MQKKDQSKKSLQENGLYVFISYARPDNKIADEVETFLTAAGVRVFRDKRDIHPGMNWDLAVEKALRECKRMVLLLSSSSMPDRKEVHREWFFFDQERKPIYPLYIEECDRHSRLRAYNHIDARSDLQEALKRLLDELGRDFDPLPPATPSDNVLVVESKDKGIEDRPLPEALQALYEAICDPEGGIVLSVEQANAIKDHNPTDLKEYRLGRIAEWSLPRHYLDKRFVNLTLLLDKGESDPQRWQKPDDYRFTELRDVLEKTSEFRTLVLLGAPGCGKSTLLRRFQLDHSIDCLINNRDEASLFIPLNGYLPDANGRLSEPDEWLNARWATEYPALPKLESYLEKGRAVLLLDALNEMPHQSPADYHRLVGLWQQYAKTVSRKGNRVLFSCRSLDYSASLSGPEMRVPQVEIQPMNPEQVRKFLKAYIPALEDHIWGELDGKPQFSLFQTPYFLKLLCEQAEVAGEVPKGRAALFTGFIRQSLIREIRSDLFQPDTLLKRTDHEKLSLGHWRDEFDLPDLGVLIPKLCDLAFRMQERRLETESAQVRIDYRDAFDLIDHDRAEDIIDAGIALNVIDKDLKKYELTFYHQLLQEYFAARKLARNPNAELVHTEWLADRVTRNLADTLKGLADGDPLPPLPQTGWEETTLTAAPMARETESFIRDLVPHNLPLAARCAASPEVSISPELRREIQDALIARAQDMKVDLRARISAGEALGEIGDPRFELREGPYGKYLLPPMVEIPAGAYPIGNDKSDYDFEMPAHTVELQVYKIGMFPVTNAEYSKFMAAGGYENEKWWDTEEAVAWLRGEASTEGSKQIVRERKKTIESWSEDFIYDLVKQNRITSEDAKNWISIRNMSDEELEQQLEDAIPSGKIYRQPEYWDDTRFNNASQPVVGVTWFEARAYCNWLTANVNEHGVPPSDGQLMESKARLKAVLRTYRLPTEVEFEAVARGLKGRLFPYGPDFEATRCNTFESHIRRSTPVGIFNNATPEGAYDLSGNVYTWTTSIYDQDKYPYPYRNDDGREDINATEVRRVLRGGSWRRNQGRARAVARYGNFPALRDFNLGFRVVYGGGPPSQ